MNPVTAALNDVVEGARLAPLWLLLGWEQVVARFRRTILGPFWLSANLLAISFVLSFVFGGLLGTDYRANFPNIIGGILVWTLIGGVMAEASGIFISSAGIMQTQRLPLTFHIFLMMQRALINFVAQLLAFWVVLTILRLGSPPTWQLVPGLALLLIDSFLLSLVIAIPSTRFRDINQFTGFFVQVLFFLTPIFWSPSQMGGKRRALLEYNPLAHMLEIVRQPLLGSAVTADHWIGAIAFGLILTILAFVLLVFFRKRIVFWL